MNQKKSKALRIIVGQMVKKGVVAAETAYGTVGMNKTTRRLDPKCARAVYKRMKRQGVASVLSGQ